MRMSVADAVDLIDFGRVAGICARKSDGSVDPRVYSLLNRSQFRLLQRGDFVGSIQLIRICIDSGCVSMPRQVERVDEAMLNGVPLSVRNPWYSFVDRAAATCGNGYWWGYGPFNWTGSSLLDAGYHSTFRDVVPGSKKLRIYPDSPNDVGKEVLIQAVDDNSQNIIESPLYNGFKMVVALPYVESAYYVSSVLGVIKPETQKNLNLYEADTSGNLRALAIYEPTETTPEYHRYRVPGFSTAAGCCNQSFLALVKLKHVPVARETDYLIIENPAAFESMIRSLEKRDADKPGDALSAEVDAVRELNLQKRNASPSEQIPIVLRTQGSSPPWRHGVGRLR